jgi:hypothetical protein
MLECMPKFYIPALDSILLQFTLKRMYCQNHVKLIGLFFSLASMMMKANIGCVL